MQQRAMSPDNFRPDDLRRQNRYRVLNSVRVHGAISRTDICDVTGLSAATVSAIASELIDAGILVHGGSSNRAPVKRGRPKTKLELNPRAGQVGILNVQLNNVSASVADYAMDVQADHAVEINTLMSSPAQLRKALTQCLDAAIRHLPKSQRQINQISVGVQGTIDVAGETLLWSPIARPTNLPIKRWLETKFAVTANVSNDADLIALALHRTRPEQFGDHFAAILLGHGVGMGLILDGVPVQGTRSSATEFGHMVHLPGGALCRCGGRGCIEAYAGDYAMIRHALNEPQDTPPRTIVKPRQFARLLDDAAAGDQRAVEAICLAGDAIGHGIANMYALLDPFPFAFVGAGTAAREFMEPAIRKALSQSVAARSGGTAASDAVGRQAIAYFADGNLLVQCGAIYRGLEVLDQEFADAAL